jgi:hypothetical protein
MSVPHPHGVQPEGNLFLLTASAAHAAHDKRRSGLGPLLSKLKDTTLLQIFSFSGPRELAMLCIASDTLAAYASFEEFWQSACLRRAAGAGFTDFRREPFAGFCGFWKRSYFASSSTASSTSPCSSSSSSPSSSSTTSSLSAKREPQQQSKPRRVAVYSDTLYRPHELMHTPSALGVNLKGPPCARIPLVREETSANTEQTILTTVADVPEFTSKYESGSGCPVVLEGAGSRYTSSEVWDEVSLRKNLGDRVLHCGGVNFRLRDYFDYARTNTDDQPLYLFDPTFDRSTPELLQVKRLRSDYAATTQLLHYDSAAILQRLRSDCAANVKRI